MKHYFGNFKKLRKVLNHRERHSSFKRKSRLIAPNSFLTVDATMSLRATLRNKQGINKADVTRGVVSL